MKTCALLYLLDAGYKNDDGSYNAVVMIKMVVGCQ